jgi:hypothetical protein
MIFAMLTATFVLPCSSLLSAGKHVQVCLDLDDTAANVTSLRDIHKKIAEADERLKQDLACTSNDRMQGHIKEKHNKEVKQYNLWLSLVQANHAHHASNEAADPSALEARLNQAVLDHLSLDQAVKQNMLFTAR